MKYDHIKQQTNISLKTTLKYIHLDNLTRLSHLERPRSPREYVVSLITPSMGSVILYRLAHWFHCKGLGIFSKFFYLLNIWLYSCEISPISDIGPGLHLVHPLGLILHAKIGKGATLYGLNGIGGAQPNDLTNGWFGGPIIGDGLSMAPGSIIVSNETIGHDVFIGAKAAVTQGVPDNAFMMGVPAKPSDHPKPQWVQDIQNRKSEIV